MTHRIALVGFMGSGKTTVGRAVASRTGLRFVDTDELVEGSTGATVAAVFAKAGEAGFRALERQAIERALAEDGCVIAVGGGAVCDRTIRRALRKACKVVFLSASVDAILARTRGTSGRPLLDGIDERERRFVVEDLLYDRTPFYQDARDILVDADAELEQVVDSVIARLGLA
jgi:shikimate kinase